MEDYERTFRDHWRLIVQHKNGGWNYPQVMKELHDYWTLLGEVRKVYVEITNGQISKPNTAALEVIDVYYRIIVEEIQEARDEMEKHSEFFNVERARQKAVAEITDASDEADLERQIINSIIEDFADWLREQRIGQIT